MSHLEREAERERENEMIQSTYQILRGGQRGRKREKLVGVLVAETILASSFLHLLPSNSVQHKYKAE
jgi:hypothetical protein